MNCDKFSENLNDFVSHKATDAEAKGLQAHMSICPKCATLAAELERTTAILQSMERRPAPIGFNDRLRSRIETSRAEAANPVKTWLKRVVRGTMGSPSTGYRWVARPALAAMMLCAIIVGSLYHGASIDSRDGDTDWAYIQNCRVQHESFVDSNPLNDESALTLKEQANSSDSDLQSAMID